MNSAADLELGADGPGDLVIENLPDGRARRTAYTRRAIGRAAAPLFRRLGVEGTAITAVAASAEVGVQTVYYHYPTKASLLVGALDHAVDGVDRRTRHTPLVDRSWARGARAEPDLQRRLFLHVRGCAELLAAGADLTQLLRAHAAGDPALTEVVDREDARHRALHRALVDSLGRDLSQLTTADQATDVLQFVLGPESWQSLVARSDWSRLAWARWAHRTLIGELLGA